MLRNVRESKDIFKGCSCLLVCRRLRGPTAGKHKRAAHAELGELFAELRAGAGPEHHFGGGTAVNELRNHFLAKSNSGVPHCSAMRHWPPSRAKRIFTRLMRKGPSIGYGGLRSVPSSKR